MLDKLIEYREFNEAEQLEVARLLGSALIKDYFKSLAKAIIIDMADAKLLGREDREIVKSQLKAQGSLEVLSTLISINDTQPKE